MTVNFKKITWAVLFIFLLAPPLNSYASSPQMQPSPDLAAIIKEGVLKVAILDQDNSPFAFTNLKGELEGIDIDMATQIATELGVKVEFVKVTSFNDVVQHVIDKKTHVGISKLSVTLERAKKIRFTGQYISMSKGLLFNRLKLKEIKTAQINTIREILEQPGVSIGVLEKSSYEKFARLMFPKTEVKTYKNWNDVIDAMLKGEVLAAFRDEWEIRKALEKRENLSLYAEAIFLEGEADPIQMIVPWDSTQLAHFLDMFILINPKFHYTVPKLFTAYKGYHNG